MVYTTHTISYTMSELEYMPYVTNNVDTFVPNETNVVACVYCREIYETKKRPSQICNCLVCEKCGIDALMVVVHSPLNGLTKTEQQALLEKWHVDGFTPIKGQGNLRFPSDPSLNGNNQ